MTILRLEFPGLLPNIAALGGNARRQGKWWEQREATGAEKVAALEAINKGLGRMRWPKFAWRYPVEVRWTVRYPNWRGVPDTDNCLTAMKPWLDALVDASVLESDKPKFVRLVSCAVEAPHPEAPMVVLEIEDAEGVSALPSATPTEPAWIARDDHQGFGSTHAG